MSSLRGARLAVSVGSSPSRGRPRRSSRIASSAAGSTAGRPGWSTTSRTTRRGDFAALKERYEARGLLSVVDAGRSIDEVADDVLEVLGHPERSAFYALGR
jgi:hypothetical protein